MGGGDGDGNGDLWLGCYTRSTLPCMTACGFLIAFAYLFTLLIAATVVLSSLSFELLCGQSPLRWTGILFFCWESVEELDLYIKLPWKTVMDR